MHHGTSIAGRCRRRVGLDGAGWDYLPAAVVAVWSLAACGFVPGLRYHGWAPAAADQPAVAVDAFTDGFVAVRVSRYEANPNFATYRRPLRGQIPWTDPIARGAA